MDDTQFMDIDCTQNFVEDGDDSNLGANLVGWIEVAGIRHELSYGITKIGRDGSVCKIVLQDEKTLSKEHARFEVDKTSVLLTDLGSRNKTRIGKMILKSNVCYALQGGEKLRFGAVNACFIKNIQDSDTDSDVCSESMLETSTPSKIEKRAGISDSSDDSIISPTPQISSKRLETTNNGLQINKSLDFIPETPANSNSLKNTSDSKQTVILESPASQSTPYGNPYSRTALKGFTTSPVGLSPISINLGESSQNSSKKVLYDENVKHSKLDDPKDEYNSDVSTDIEDFFEDYKSTKKDISSNAPDKMSDEAAKKDYSLDNSLDNSDDTQEVLNAFVDSENDEDDTQDIISAFERPTQVIDEQDIMAAATQKVGSPPRDNLFKKPFVPQRRSSKQDFDIHDAPTQVFPTDGESFAQKEDSKLHDIYDAPTQVFSIDENTNNTSSSKESDADENDSVYDAPTQIFDPTCLKPKMQTQEHEDKDQSELPTQIYGSFSPVSEKFSYETGATTNKDVKTSSNNSEQLSHVRNSSLESHQASPDNIKLSTSVHDSLADKSDDSMSICDAPTQIFEIPVDVCQAPTQVFKHETSPQHCNDKDDSTLTPHSNFSEIDGEETLLFEPGHTEINRLNIDKANEDCSDEVSNRHEKNSDTQKEENTESTFIETESTQMIDFECEEFIQTKEEEKSSKTREENEEHPKCEDAKKSGVLDSEDNGDEDADSEVSETLLKDDKELEEDAEQTQLFSISAWHDEVSKETEHSGEQLIQTKCVKDVNSTVNEHSLGDELQDNLKAEQLQMSEKPVGVEEQYKKVDKYGDNHLVSNLESFNEGSDMSKLELTGLSEDLTTHSERTKLNNSNVPSSSCETTTIDSPSLPDKNEDINYTAQSSISYDVPKPSSYDSLNNDDFSTEPSTEQQLETMGVSFSCIDFVSKDSLELTEPEPALNSLEDNVLGEEPGEDSPDIIMCDSEDETSITKLNKSISLFDIPELDTESNSPIKSHKNEYKEVIPNKISDFTTVSMPMSKQIKIPKKDEIEFAPEGISNSASVPENTSISEKNDTTENSSKELVDIAGFNTNLVKNIGADSIFEFPNDILRKTNISTDSKTNFDESKKNITPKITRQRRTRGAEKKVLITKKSERQNRSRNKTNEKTESSVENCNDTKKVNLDRRMRNNRGSLNKKSDHDYSDSNENSILVKGVKEPNIVKSELVEENPSEDNATHSLREIKNRNSRNNLYQKERNETVALPSNLHSELINKDSSDVGSYSKSKPKENSDNVVQVRIIRRGRPSKVPRKYLPDWNETVSRKNKRSMEKREDKTNKRVKKSVKQESESPLVSNKKQIESTDTKDSSVNDDTIAVFTRTTRRKRAFQENKEDAEETGNRSSRKFSRLSKIEETNAKSIAKEASDDLSRNLNENIKPVRQSRRRTTATNIKSGLRGTDQNNKRMSASPEFSKNNQVLEEKSSPIIKSRYNKATKNVSDTVRVDSKDTISNQQHSLYTSSVQISAPTKENPSTTKGRCSKRVNKADGVENNNSKTVTPKSKTNRHNSSHSVAENQASIEENTTRTRTSKIGRNTRKEEEDKSKLETLPVNRVRPGRKASYNKNEVKKEDSVKGNKEKPKRNSSILRSSPAKSTRSVRSSRRGVSPDLERDVVLSSPVQRQAAATRRPRVLFTTFKDSKYEKIIKDSGGILVDSVSECSVLVMNNVRRTCKFLACVAKGLPIVSTEWVTATKKAGNFVDPWLYIISDPESESKFGFCLSRSLSVASKKRILTGYSVYVTDSVKPPPDQMKEIVECAGGDYLDAAPKVSSPYTVIVSCEEDKKSWTSFRRHKLSIVSPEFILTGILRQKIMIADFKF